MINSQQILLLNIIFGVLLVAYFWFGRSQPQKPTRLNLKNDNLKKKEAVLQDDSSKNTVILQKSEMNLIKNEVVEKNFSTSEVKHQVKDLSVFFMYNGHDWEAHDVLGVPRGLSLQKVTIHYQSLITSADPSVFEFYESAYRAITESHKIRKL